MCWCDTACESFADCCPDYTDLCPAGNPSCEGSCGGTAPTGCWCDELCESFADCCEDKTAVCDGPSPSDCPTEGTGDATGDGDVNVLDVVFTVNLILGQEVNPPFGEDCLIATVDLNTDGAVNVLDVVALVSLILN